MEMTDANERRNMEHSETKKTTTACHTVSVCFTIVMFYIVTKLENEDIQKSIQYCSQNYCMNINM